MHNFDALPTNANQEMVIPGFTNPAADKMINAKLWVKHWDSTDFTWIFDQYEEF
jgi:hypothetical protein